MSRERKISLWLVFERLVHLNGSVTPQRPDLDVLGVALSKTAAGEHAWYRLKQMSPEELSRVEEIDVTERGLFVYHYREGKLETKRQAWHRGRRDAAVWGNYIKRWNAVLERGGVALGAFDGKRLVGMAVLEYHLTERMAHLVALFVSQDSRRHGVAAQLAQEVMRLAKAQGADQLYVSATPSESAIGFYLSQGFAPAKQVHKELYALEPEDIHLLRQL